MPIVDGLASTKMIRSFEKSHPTNDYSERAKFNGRVPVFAVSASLVERDLQIYVEAGFDGWILKPVDFHRLSELFNGIIEQDTRESCLYTPGKWERGGWFARHTGGTFPVSLIPSGRRQSSTVAFSDSSSLVSEENRSRERLDGLQRVRADAPDLKPDLERGSRYSDEAEDDVEITPQPTPF